MKNSKHTVPDQEVYDPETGEVRDRIAEDLIHEQIVEELVGNGREGAQPDGTIVLSKITMATIRANPERCKLSNPPAPKKIALVTGIAGGEVLMPGMDGARFENLLPADPEYMTFCALVASLEPWGCVRFDDEGEPDAVFKSDYLFLPIGHIHVVQKVRQLGQFAIATELWAQPTGKAGAGYSWYYHNLAKYDRGMSYIDRLLMHGVAAGRALRDKREHVGLLADLRSR